MTNEEAKHCIRKLLEIGGCDGFDYKEKEALEMAIKFEAMDDAFNNAKPLPKGHGRLIDADAINTHDISPIRDMEIYGVTEYDIDAEPTIIEADKEG